MQHHPPPCEERVICRRQGQLLDSVSAAAFFSVHWSLLVPNSQPLISHRTALPCREASCRLHAPVPCCRFSPRLACRSSAPKMHASSRSTFVRARQASNTCLQWAEVQGRHWHHEQPVQACMQLSSLLNMAAVK